MSNPQSHYRPEAAPDYAHRFHAGNVGDVWKHCVLVEVLRRAGAATPRVTYVESHAGEGAYALAPTGEWNEGIGRLWSADGDLGDVVGRYLTLCRALGAGGTRPERYPGSPAFARSVLGSRARLALWERDASACNRLRESALPDENTRITCADGLVGLADEIRAAETLGDTVVVLIDPPFTHKADWTSVPDALAYAAAGSRRASLLLWYPVKSLTRPNAMIARLQHAGVSASVAELITTPLGERRNRLNGSGVVLVRPPQGTLEALAAAAPVAGARCATRAGSWSFRLVSW